MSDAEQYQDRTSGPPRYVDGPGCTPAELKPLTPDEMPPQLQEALRRMSNRGRVVDMGTGAVVAEGGRLVGEGGQFLTGNDHASDARLTIEMDGNTVVAATLQHLALAARAGSDEVLTFLYRDPLDEEEPDARRPVRRARLVVEELGEVAEG